MKVKFVVDEDLVNYRLCSMFIGFPKCDFKCDRENGNQICQNSALAREPDIDVDIDELVERYCANPLSQAVVCGGLEPLDSFDDLKAFCRAFRERSRDDIVIYTGYKLHEAEDKINELRFYEPLVVKYGRFIPNRPSKFDHQLGVTLASNNQVSVRYWNGGEYI